MGDFFTALMIDVGILFCVACLINLAAKSMYVVKGWKRGGR